MPDGSRAADKRKHVPEGTTHISTIDGSLLSRHPQNALPGVVLSLCCENTLIWVLTARPQPISTAAVRREAVLMLLSRTILEIADKVKTRCTDCWMRGGELNPARGHRMLVGARSLELAVVMLPWSEDGVVPGIGAGLPAKPYQCGRCHHCCAQTSCRWIPRATPPTQTRPDTRASQVL